MTRLVKRTRWVDQNSPVSDEEARKLGMTRRDSNAEAEMAATDALPALVRQHINESPFEYSAVTILEAYRAALRSDPFTSPERAAAELVVFLYERDTELIRKANAERGLAAV